MDGDHKVIDRAWLLLKSSHPELVDQLEASFFDPLEQAIDEESFSEWKNAMRVIAVSVANYFDEDLDQETSENVTIN